VSSEDFAVLLLDLLFEHDDTTAPVEHVETFRDAGLLTRDEGLVVRFASGDEFQVTVVQSDHGEAA
jgi:hypothetical protein